VPELLLPLVAALAGLVIGSFLNVIISRVPAGESVVSPSSHCPHCGHRLRPWENIPVISWIVLGGRCRSCKQEISPRYMLVELATAALFALAAAEFGQSLATLGACIFAAFALVTLFVDIDHLLILDVLTLPVALAGAVIALASGKFIGAIEGAALGIALFGLMYFATRGAGLGFGDVKLAGCLGVFCGLDGSIAAFAAAFIIGAILAIPVLLTRKRRAKDVLPLGPFLVLGALIVIFAPALVFGPYAAYQVFLYRHLGGGA
jgi:leader peptidase (prepilin peptidase) / N-methyltransferase